MKRITRATRPSGFTLIELMIVVVIIGLLSSVAIPELISFSRRTKKSERKVIMVAIARSLNDYWITNGKIPGGGTSLTLPTNPPYPPNGIREYFNANLGNWVDLPFKPEGTLYYRYDVTISLSAVPPTMVLTATGDLDRNTIPNIETDTYTLQDGVWQPTTEVESGDIF